MEHPIIVRSHRGMICADWVAGAQALAFKGGLQNLGKAMGDFDEAAQGSLVSCARSVDKDAALDWLTRKPREKVYAFFQGAGRVAAVDRDLGHEGMSQAVSHDVFRPLALVENIRADGHAPRTLCVYPSSGPRPKLLSTREHSRPTYPLG